MDKCSGRQGQNNQKLNLFFKLGPRQVSLEHRKKSIFFFFFLFLLYTCVGTRQDL